MTELVTSNPPTRHELGAESTTVGIAPWAEISHAAKNGGKSYGSALDMVRDLGLDWTVAERQLIVPTGESAGAVTVAKGFKAVLREDTQDVLGVVKSRYQTMQNGEALGFAADLAAADRLSLVAGGWLGNGEKVWVLCDLGQVEIPGRVLKSGELDTFGKFLLFYTSHDGSSAVRMSLVPFAFGCANALPMVNRSTKADERWSIRHTRNAKAKLAQVNARLKDAMELYDAWGRDMIALDREPMKSREMREFAEKLIAETRRTIDGMKGELSDKAKASQQADVDKLVELFSDGASNLGRSKLDALHAVTEFIDHHRKRRADARARLNDYWFGGNTRATRQRALRMLRG